MLYILHPIKHRHSYHDITHDCYNRDSHPLLNFQSYGISSTLRKHIYCFSISSEPATHDRAKIPELSEFTAPMRLKRLPITDITLQLSQLNTLNMHARCHLSNYVATCLLFNKCNFELWIKKGSDFRFNSVIMFLRGFWKSIFISS